MARGDQVNRRSVPARVRDFLRDRPGRIYCDTCIQERLGLKWRQQAQLITATLGVTSEFDRGRWTCSTCGQVKFGISARRVQQDLSPPNLAPPNLAPAKAGAAPAPEGRLVMRLNRSR